MLDQLVSQLSDDNVRAKATAAAKEKVTASVEANRDAVTAAVTAAVRENVAAQVTASVHDQVTAAVIGNLGYSVDEYNAAVAEGLVDETTQAQGYTWYRIGVRQWIADKDGGWLDYHPD